MTSIPEGASLPPLLITSSVAETIKAFNATTNGSSLAKLDDNTFNFTIHLFEDRAAIELGAALVLRQTRSMALTVGHQGLELDSTVEDNTTQQQGSIDLVGVCEWAQFGVVVSVR
jgi:hypothetical protein